MSDHSLLAPSSMSRILSCPASLAQQHGCVDKGSKYAWEGTAAHTLYADCLVQSLPTTASLGRVIDVVEQGKKVAEFEVDEEMAGYVQSALDYVNDLVAANDSEMYVEQKVNFSDVVQYPDSCGTSDTILLHPLADNKVELHVIDYKHGKGVKVDAEQNEQMMTYALGALQSYLYSHDVASVRMTILQPRIGHISEWSIPVEDLGAWGANEMRSGCNKALAILETKIQNPQVEIAAELYNPNEDNCKFCKGKATCPALRREVQEAIGCSFDDLDATIAELDDKPEPIEPPSDDDILDDLYPKIDMIYDWCSSVLAKIESRLLQGATFKNAKLVIGRKGNRQWTDAKEVEQELKAMRLRDNQMYKMELISPAQAEKLLKDTPRRWKRIKDKVRREHQGKPSVAPIWDTGNPYELPKVEFDDLDAEGAEDLA